MELHGKESPMKFSTSGKTGNPFSLIVQCRASQANCSPSVVCHERQLVYEIVTPSPPGLRQTKKGEQFCTSSWNRRFVNAVWESVIGDLKHLQPAKVLIKCRRKASDRMRFAPRFVRNPSQENVLSNVTSAWEPYRKAYRVLCTNQSAHKILQNHPIHPHENILQGHNGFVYILLTLVCKINIRYCLSPFRNSNNHLPDQDDIGYQASLLQLCFKIDTAQVDKKAVRDCTIISYPVLIPIKAKRSGWPYPKGEGFQARSSQPRRNPSRCLFTFISTNHQIVRIKIPKEDKVSGKPLPKRERKCTNQSAQFTTPQATYDTVSPFGTYQLTIG